jgi:Domain of unknown function (DUF927)
MPTPMVVNSGNGIHCYWPLSRSVSAEHWEKASIALRLALESQQLQIDVSKVHDASMVLRPVGTHHKKQSPWKPVQCMLDSPDYEPLELFTLLKPWFGKLPTTAGRAPRAATHRRSGVMSALLETGDIVLESVVQGCRQLGALVASGGVLDAAGAPVGEPMWRLGLGFAKYCTDQEAAVVALSGQHPEFDLATNMQKLSMWKATGPTTCAAFEAMCSAGCAGCPRKGTITSPASLSRVVDVAPPPGAVEVELPSGYFIDDGKIWMDEEKEITQTASDGKKVKSTVLEKVMVAPREMHITGIYTDLQFSSTTATLAVRYPLGNWAEHDMPLSVMSGPKDLSEYMINKQVFFVDQNVLERTRRYLMRYLDMVQKQAPSGTDFAAFGWQPDGSFLCGDNLIGAPSGNTARRLKGAAAHYSDRIGSVGEFSKWTAATAMLNNSAAVNHAAAILMAGSGVFGDALGNASCVVSFYSTRSSTGKTVALYAANSTFGHPKRLLMRAKDTVNATYKMRGVLNHLPGTVDELTTIDKEAAVDLAYSFSEGREKVAMDQYRNLREPAVWAGPTMVSCNSSLIDKYSQVMAQSEPVRVRTLELLQDDQAFVSAPVDNASDFVNVITDNYGFFIPAIVEYVVSNGGAREIAVSAVAAFDKKFGFAFLPEERFYKTTIIGAWITGVIGKKIGAIQFDTDRVITYLLNRVVELRDQASKAAHDAFDVIGQFLQEHNDMLLVASEEYVQSGKSKEVVQYPLPLKAVARLTLVYDHQNPVLPGSRLAINAQLLKRWLSKGRDSLDRLLAELAAAGAVIQTNHRVTIYKGCPGTNPAQTFCLVLNMNHPRFAQAFTGAKSYQPSQVALALVNGATT